jgi:hypothetical protein
MGLLEARDSHLQSISTLFDLASLLVESLRRVVGRREKITKDDIFHIGCDKFFSKWRNLGCMLVPVCNIFE